MQGKAYFIDPKGNLIPSDTKHINTIFDYPEKFGYTSEELRQIYDNYHEKYRIEGKAREEILSDLLNQGWMRVREYINPSFWSIQLKKLDKYAEENISKFALMVKMRKVSNQGHEDSIFKISSLKTNRNWELSVKDILNYKLYDMLEAKEQIRGKKSLLEMLKNKNYNPYLNIIKIEDYGGSI